MTMITTKWNNFTPEEPPFRVSAARPYGTRPLALPLKSFVTSIVVLLGDAYARPLLLCEGSADPRSYGDGETSLRHECQSLNIGARERKSERRRSPKRNGHGIGNASNGGGGKVLMTR